MINAPCKFWFHKQNNDKIVLKLENILCIWGPPPRSRTFLIGIQRISQKVIKNGEGLGILKKFQKTNILHHKWTLPKPSRSHHLKISPKISLNWKHCKLAAI